jgi:integrase
MTVHLRDGRFIVDTIWPDGKRTRRQALSEKHANKLDVRIRASRIDGIWHDLRTKLNMEHTEVMTLEDLGKIYLEQYVKQRNRDLRSKKSRIAIINREIGKILLTEVDQAAVTKFASKRHKAGVSSRTINRDIAVLRHMLMWAVKRHLIEVNPLSEWDRLAEKPFEGRRPTEEIIDVVFEHLNETVNPLFTFLRYTGCRREEALSLKWSQVDIKNQAVHLYRTKNGKSRSVPLTVEAVDAIKAMPRVSKTEYVFYSAIPSEVSKSTRERMSITSCGRWGIARFR